MSSFKRIVRNYKQIYKLGNELINHKAVINTLPDELKYEEFHKQELRIQKFLEITEKANSEWNDNQETINTYWTGLS